MKIGVFDSGIGGKAIADSLADEFIQANIMRVDDHLHLPYGDKSLSEVRQLTDAAVQPLIEAQCDVIVIACNTATAAAIEYLRDTYPGQSFVGLEPMVKPAAAQTKTGVIAIFATPATLRSQRYRALKASYAQEVLVLEPECRSWAQMIETNQINEALIRIIVTDVLDAGADVIVLACTHYHWIRILIENIAQGRATIIDPSAAIAKQIRSLMENIIARESRSP